MSSPSESKAPASGPIHIVISRRVRPGCEAAYQQSLREFFQTSFGHEGVLGASMLVPPPGSGPREFGILRTFASERDRDAFYASALFQDWDRKVAPLTEEGGRYRQLHGMEAWFRSPQSAPARWKMALLTWLAVWPVTLVMRALLAPVVGAWMPAVLLTGLITGGVVVVLTWVAMPLLVSAASRWLQPPVHPALGEERQIRDGQGGV